MYENTLRYKLLLDEMNYFDGWRNRCSFNFLVWERKKEEFWSWRIFPNAVISLILDDIARIRGIRYWIYYYAFM